jgi:RND family efflux transporter MFP subunit
MGTVWVLVDVSEAKLGEIAVGSQAVITVAAQSGKTFEGTISYVSPELDPSTRTARVRVEVKNPQEWLLPGMFAQARLTAAPGGEIGAAEAVVAVPEDAVQTVEGEPAVFVPVEGEPNSFAKRPVQVGKPVGGMTPILAGLKQGEEYVASGSFILKAELGKAGAAHEH